MGTRGQLNTRHFARFLQRNGERPLRYLRRVGPCPNTHNRAIGLYNTDPTCALCGGVGEVFREVDLAPVWERSPAHGKLALVNALLSKQKQPLELVTGELQCTYLPDDYPLADGDRLYLRSRDAWTSQLLVVSETGGTDYLRLSPVLQIAAVYTADGELDASLYRVSDDERGVTWDASVTQGTQVTLRYQFRPVWMVVAGTQLSRIEADNGDRFPNRCLLRMWQGLDLDVREGDL